MEIVKSISVVKVAGGFVVNVTHISDNTFGHGSVPYLTQLGAHYSYRHYLVGGEVVDDESERFFPFSTKADAEDEILRAYLTGELKGGNNKYERATLAVNKNIDLHAKSSLEKDIYQAYAEAQKQFFLEAKRNLHKSKSNTKYIILVDDKYLTSLRKNSYDYSYDRDKAKVFTIDRNAIAAAVKVKNIPLCLLAKVRVINKDTDHILWDNGKAE